MRFVQFLFFRHALAQDIQFTHAGYPVLEAISNLYLNKQIAFEKL